MLKTSILVQETLTLPAAISTEVLFVLRLFVRSIEKDCGQKLRNHYNQVN
jgi:hypothetical protein